MSFDRVIVVDWSAASRLQPVPRADSIWFGIEEAGRAWTEHLPGRRAAEARLEALTETGRVLVGFDFPLAGPAGLAERLTGREDPTALRDWLEARIVDGADNRNNRFEVAAGMNRLLGVPAFWGVPRRWTSPIFPPARPATTWRSACPNGGGSKSSGGERSRSGSFTPPDRSGRRR